MLWASLVAQRIKNLPAMPETPVQFLGQEDPLEGFPGGSDSKEPPAMRETWVQSLGWEAPWEEGIATHSSILAWRICLDRGAWWAIFHGVAKNRT